MKKFVLFFFLFAIVSLPSVSMKAQLPDNLPKERQISNKQDNRRARYQGDVAIEHILNLDDYILGFTGVTTTHGVRSGDYFYVGAGAGLFVWAPLTLVNPSFFYVPVFFSANGYFSIGKRKRLCTSLDVGKNIGQEEDLYIYPRIGISFLNSRYSRQINLSIGYQKSSPFLDFKDPGAIGFKVSYSW